jgi:hypothetical protein
MNYFPRLALNHKPPDLTSQVARIIGMGYQYPPQNLFTLAAFHCSLGIESMPNLRYIIQFLVVS